MSDPVEPRIDIRYGTYEMKGDRRTYATICAGRKKTERVIPPAGAKYAFDRDIWDHRIEIYVSPTGRSVQIYVDGERVG